MSEPIDIGHGHTIRLIGWHPDRDLSPQYAGIPNQELAVVLIEHPDKAGGTCASAASVFRLPNETGPVWNIESREPLTLSPSLLCLRCGDHGFIREGKWVPA